MDWTDLTELAGFAAVAIGAGLIYLPAGVIVGGLIVVFLSWMAS